MPRIPRQQPRLDFLNLYPAVVPSVIMFMMPLQQLDGLPSMSYNLTSSAILRSEPGKHTQLRALHI